MTVLHGVEGRALRARLLLHAGLFESRGLGWMLPCFINVSAGELRTSGPPSNLIPMCVCSGGGTPSTSHLCGRAQSPMAYLVQVDSSNVHLDEFLTLRRDDQSAANSDGAHELLVGSLQVSPFQSPLFIYYS